MCVQVGRPTDHLLVGGREGEGRGLAAEDAVREAEERLQRGIRMMADPMAAMGFLKQLAQARCMAALHPCHRLSFELALALVSSSAMVGAPAAAVRAEYSLKAIEAMEAVLVVGTPQLASLYASHSAALLQLIRGRAEAAPPPMCEQCLATLRAALAIRTVCFGEDDALARSTRRACESARQAIRQATGRELPDGGG